MLPGGLDFPLDHGFSSSKGFGTYPLEDRVEFVASSREASNLGQLATYFFSRCFSFRHSGISTSDPMQPRFLWLIGNL